uniref:Polyketide synthase n=1 Tax=Pestalotiopsis microspora TaxID=85828 RepID=A0A1P8NTM3_PESMI|nr:polyketide synthase [Pestalotiopsis microspora]
MTSTPSMIVFGSLGSWPSDDKSKSQREALLKHECLAPVVDAVHDLPSLWETIVARDSDLETLKGYENARKLSGWIFGSSEVQAESQTASNSITMPFTIIEHLCQYFDYLATSQDGKTLSHADCLARTSKGGGIQGFCAGLLSAITIAGASDEKEIGLRGALAVRLAFAIGAYVDADAQARGTTTSVAVRWKSPDTIDTIEEILQNHSQAYISVIKNTHDATISAPQSNISSLTRDLVARGITTVPTNVLGRYHSTIHENSLTKIIDACDIGTNLNLYGAALVRSNVNGEPLGRESTVLSTIRSIMTQVSDWHSVLRVAVSDLHRLAGDAFILSVGLDSIPQPISQGLRIVRASSLSSSNNVDKLASRYPTSAVAVIGMSCKFPGADSIEEFWELISTGKSMVEPVPTERFGPKESPRPQKGKPNKYWGNFMRDVDAFDHRFFKKTSREAASMDPQQRLLLQATYEALESSGYFADHSEPRDIGCYIGLCATDYDSNVASHQPNAFSTLGTLRAFLSGKLSHFFGWSGPSMTFDTACSSSAVAIHSACRAIQAGECSQAVAGGVALFTSPYLYENLSAAHFLSPTGATKPFDAQGDGYCRGEGLGLVVLKSLGSAVADGDDIFGVIAGSAVNQNDNSVPITVPYSPSQSELYRNVCKQAGISPSSLSFVEAHGTGTPVGDPIEMESIRAVFGGPQRDTQLIVSSVKGNIGHLEGASGVAGLIKTLLQIEKRSTCIQASFSSLNPSIAPLQPSNMAIPTATLALPSGFLTACVNNYGAAGSNAAMIVMEPPQRQICTRKPDGRRRYPVFVAANSHASLISYFQKLGALCQISSQTAKESLPSIAFNLAKRQNQGLPYALAATAYDSQDLQTQLRQLSTSPPDTFQRPKSEPPLVLAFGGQVSSHVGLDKTLWEQSSLLRLHLDKCDEILTSLGHPSIYPAIFETQPIGDVVLLHSLVFSLQYASAQAWIDSGLKIDGIVGHSLGQLTALTVSEALSLKDGLRLVAGRAALMKQHWGAESGSMIAVEATSEMLSSISHNLEIACYNGESSHVLVGESASVDLFEQEAAARALRFKRLNVTNGFHSKFTDPLISPLQRLASQLRLSEPSIYLETCSDGTTWHTPTPELIAQHTRDPVYFAQAIQRLADRLGPCTWLEAGSDSSVVSMVRRALGNADVASHAFQATSLSKASSHDNVVTTTVQLWKLGHKVQYWNFHRAQAGDYDIIRLPSYQFEKNRHWLELLPLSSPAVPATLSKSQQEKPLPLTLLSLIKLNAKEALFQINTSVQEYQVPVSGHVVAGSALCPATMYIEMAAKSAVRLLGSDYNANDTFAFEELRIESPLGMNQNQALFIRLESIGDRQSTWRYTVSSQTGSSASTSHATGLIVYQQGEKCTLSIRDEFERYERLAAFRQIEALYNDSASDLIRGAMVYKSFARVVEYADCYRGIKSIAAKNGQLAATVSLSGCEMDASFQGLLTQPSLLDSFMQIGGLYANNLFPCDTSDVFVFTKLDRLQFGPGFRLGDAADHQQWMLYGNSTPSGSPDKELANDIFVFDPTTKRLAVLILGAKFTKVKLSLLTKVLARVNATPGDKPLPVLEEKLRFLEASEPQISAHQIPEPTISNRPILRTPKPVLDQTSSIFNGICDVVVRVAEVPRGQITGSVALDQDLGIDSLLMMEVIGEISNHFNVEIPLEDLLTLANVDALVHYLSKRGCGSVDAALNISSGESESGSSDISDTDTASTQLTTAIPTPYPGSSDVAAKLASLLQEHLELPTPPGMSDNLADLGLDSLLCIELASDIETLFSTSIDVFQLNETSTFSSLVQLVLPTENSALPHSFPFPSSTDANASVSLNQINASSQDQDALLLHAQRTFEDVRFDFDKFSLQTKFTNFWSEVYPDQARLVLSYIGHTFAKLGIDLAIIPESQRLPALNFLPRHQSLVKQLHKILIDGGYVETRGGEYVRTSVAFNLPDPANALEEILRKFPHHSAEHKLLNVTGSRLTECLTGKVDPLQLLFANRANRQLLADVYDYAPMCQAATQLLADFLAKALSCAQKGETFHLLEIGGGTGGTTRFLVNFLEQRGISFTYTFTDISSALVGAAKKTFSSYECMRYAVLDVEHAPTAEQQGKYHVIISTNCIHATSNAAKSLTNLRSMLRPDGLMALVEFSPGLYWFDLVWGLLPGWWAFSDGRVHALADEQFWDRNLRAAGFRHVSWTDGTARECRTLRFICGFVAEAEQPGFVPKTALASLPRRAGVPVETLVFKKIGALELCADVYYPSEPDDRHTRRPIALLIHGGGHIVFTRKDIHMKHIKELHRRGFLSVSIDYRLCPEAPLVTGAIADVADALTWVREALPHHTSARGWKNPIYPKCIVEAPGASDYSLLAGVRDEPIAGYEPKKTGMAPSLAMSLQDERWRLVIHMNWKAQLVPMLVSGLPSKRKATAKGLDLNSLASLPMPPAEAVRAASPYAQILRGHYATPTFIVHGRRDDLIPWQQSQETFEALRSRGVNAEIAVPDAGHAFDLFPSEDTDGAGWRDMMSSYDFLCRHVFHS